MNDIELASKIASLKWEIDLSAGTVKSDMIHYRIVNKKEFVDLRDVWISPDMPAVISVINQVQNSAVEAYREAIKDA
jgi:hypothetical protein